MPSERIQVTDSCPLRAGSFVPFEGPCQRPRQPKPSGVTVERYVVAEDCGALINPAIVEGQIRGGVAPEDHLPSAL
jgi:hypothetical protein